MRGRIFGIILCAILLFTLVGCGGGADDEADIVLYNQKQTFEVSSYIEAKNKTVYVLSDDTFVVGVSQGLGGKFTLEPLSEGAATIKILCYDYIEGSNTVLDEESSFSLSVIVRFRTQSTDFNMLWLILIIGAPVLCGGGTVLFVLLRKRRARA